MQDGVAWTGVFQAALRAEILPIKYLHTRQPLGVAE
jgi:hypothetical protein